MRRLHVGFVTLVVCFATASLALAQSAGLDGYITDEQGTAIPGVTVTVAGPALIAPAVAVSDERGYYRLLDLRPGEYAMSAELAGFTTIKREGIQARVGSTFTVNLQMRVGGIEETVIVSGAPPLIDTQSAGTTVNVGGELLRSAPLTSRRLWSDVLDMAPAVSSRQVTGLDVGKRAYYFLGTHIYGHSLTVNGAPVAAYSDGAAHSVDLSADAIDEVEMKTGGIDAASPNATGVVVNVITKRGGDAFRGSAAFTYQDIDWTGNNADDGGLPTKQGIKITDVTLGGPVVRSKAWFFGLLRYSDLNNGISRAAADLAAVRSFRPDFVPFDNWSRSYQPYGSLTWQATSQHSIQFVFQHDRSRFIQDGPRNADQIAWGGTGGSLAHARLSSVWGQRVTTQLSASWNNKGGAGKDSFKDHTGTGASVVVHRDAFLSRGLPTGTGALGTMNNVQSQDIREGEVFVVRGDLTYLVGGGGTHELRTGFYAAPRLHYDVVAQAVNDGYVLEEVRQADPGNPAAGLVPFHRRFSDVPTQQVVRARDRDIGLYLQDSWKPTAALTVNAGVRVEFVRRYDDLFGVERQRSVDVGPRLGATYAMNDGQTVLRASYGRVHEAVNGRDPITLLGSPIGSGGGVVIQTSRAGFRDEYDTNGDGVMDRVVLTPASAQRLYDLEFADGLHQPYVDEAIVGLRHQFPGLIGVDVSWTHRSYRDRWAVVDINGIYPGEPLQPFGGFGRVDPNRGLFYQQRNADWSTQVYSALQAVVTKSLSNGFEVLVGVNRQWQRVSGTWNPTDPARFIQPDAFSNDRELGHIFGNDEHNSLDGRGIPTGAANRPYSVRVAARYLGPKEVRIATSYVIQAGDYSGPILTRIAAADPRFGPVNVTLANGTTQPNPLATTIRFANATRSEGQVRNDTSRYLQVSLSRAFRFKGNHQVEPTVNVFNVFNNGAQTQFAAGGNQLYSPNYLLGTNRHPPRSVSITLAYRF